MFLITLVAEITVSSIIHRHLSVYRSLSNDFTITDTWRLLVLG